MFYSHCPLSACTHFFTDTCYLFTYFWQMHLFNFIIPACIFFQPKKKKKKRREMKRKMNGVEINTRAYVATRLLLRWDYLYAVTLKTKVFGDYNHARLEVRLLPRGDYFYAVTPAGRERHQRRDQVRLGRTENPSKSQLSHFFENDNKRIRLQHHVFSPFEQKNKCCRGLGTKLLF